MFNHGLSTAALFLVTGFLIRRRGSQLISDFGGVARPDGGSGLSSNGLLHDEVLSVLASG